MQTPCVACHRLGDQPSLTDPHPHLELITSIDAHRPAPPGTYAYRCRMCGHTLLRNTNYQDAEARWSFVTPAF